MSENKPTVDEKKTAGASYIFTFYKGVQTLTHNYAVYINFIAQLELKYSKEEIDLLNTVISEEEKAQLNQMLVELRYSIIVNSVYYDSISKVVKGVKDKDVEEAYNEVKKGYVIKRDKLENYVLLMNKVLLNGVVKTLLETSQQIIDSVFES